jgi:pantoate--beta-alanine ligase
MGNLHDGHVSLVELAQSLAHRVVVSIYVNPTQFGPSEDFASYPRTLQADEAILQAHGTDLLFAPGVEEIYPFGPEGSVQVSLPGLGEDLCGASRPGHFDGVTGVVCRLLNIIAPDLVVFGEKDFQQLVILRRMVADLRMPIRVVAAPICREADGLAMSSRNSYLSDAERDLAPLLYHNLRKVADGIEAGVSDYETLARKARKELAEAGFQPDYVEVRQAGDLAAPNGSGDIDLVVLGAARLGKARLIDNLRVSPVLSNG